jgi:hypothetical protein
LQNGHGKNLNAAFDLSVLRVWCPKVALDLLMTVQQDLEGFEHLGMDFKTLQGIMDRALLPDSFLTSLPVLIFVKHD